MTPWFYTFCLILAFGWCLKDYPFINLWPVIVWLLVGVIVLIKDTWSKYD